MTVLCPKHETLALWVGVWICPIDGAVIPPPVRWAA